MRAPARQPELTRLSPAHLLHTPRAAADTTGMRFARRRRCRWPSRRTRSASSARSTGACGCCVRACAHPALAWAVCCGVAWRRGACSDEQPRRHRERRRTQMPHARLAHGGCCPCAVRCVHALQVPGGARDSHPLAAGPPKHHCAREWRRQARAPQQRRARHTPCARAAPRARVLPG
jgi:hypothetical protein